MKAADGIAPVAKTLRALVLAAIQRAGEDGLTDEEGIAATGIGPSTYRPRRIDLATKVGGFRVRDSGRTRLTKSGRKAVVWVCAATHEGEP